MRVTKYLDSMLTKEEIKETDKEAQRIEDSIISLRKSVADEVKHILDEKKISFNALKKELDISSTTLSKLVKGEGNITMATIALLSQVSHKRPRIVWEDEAV